MELPTPTPLQETILSTPGDNEVSTDNIINTESMDLVIDEKELNETNNKIEPTTNTKYQVTDEEVVLLQKQIEVDVDKARELLLKYNGDQVEALMELYDTNYQPPPTIGLATSSTKTLELNGVLQDYQNNTEEATVKYPVIHNVLNTSPDFLEKFKTAYTYLIAPLTLENNGITKFKKYGRLPEVIHEKVLEVVKTNYSILSKYINNGNSTDTNSCDDTMSNDENNIKNSNGIDLEKLNRWRKNRGTLKNIISSKGKDGNLPELNRIYTHLRVETMISKWEESEMNVYPLQGNTQELLDKWDMTHAGLVMFQGQVKNKVKFEQLYPGYFQLINKNATQLAHQNNVISDEEIVVGHTAIINPCY